MCTLPEVSKVLGLGWRMVRGGPWVTHTPLYLGRVWTFFFLSVAQVGHPNGLSGQTDGFWAAQ
jgi:hypothetical protein